MVRVKCGNASGLTSERTHPATGSRALRKGAGREATPKIRLGAGGGVVVPRLVRLVFFVATNRAQPALEWLLAGSCKTMHTITRLQIAETVEDANAVLEKGGRLQHIYTVQNGLNQEARYVLSKRIIREEQEEKDEATQ